jgi:hypothetical protein
MVQFWFKMGNWVAKFFGPSPNFATRYIENQPRPLPQLQSELLTRSGNVFCKTCRALEALQSLEDSLSEQACADSVAELRELRTWVNQVHRESYTLYQAVACCDLHIEARVVGVLRPWRNTPFHEHSAPLEWRTGRVFGPNWEDEDERSAVWQPDANV